MENAGLVNVVVATIIIVVIVVVTISSGTCSKCVRAHHGKAHAFGAASNLDMVS